MTFETGDIILVKVNKFSTWYRWLLAKLIQVFDGVYYHHAGTIVSGLLLEADTRVIRSSPAARLSGDEIIVFRLKRPLDGDERYLFERLAEEALERKYDYWGTLFHQLLYILSLRRVWIGKTGPSARRKQYCTELVVDMIHRVRGYFPRPWLTSPRALIEQAPRYYDVVYEGLFKLN